MPSRSFSTGRLSLVISVALVACLAIHVGVDYGYSGVAFFPSFFSTANTAEGQIKQSPACAVDRQMDWLSQSTNQTPTTMNLLLVCPGVAVALKDHHQHRLQQSHAQSPLPVFTQQLRSYIEFQLQQRADPHLEWIFFLKDHETLFSHTPGSLRKFVHHAPSEVHVLTFAPPGKMSASSSTDTPWAAALGLFAIGLDRRSVRLLDSVQHLLEQRPGLTETDAIAIALASSHNNARGVVVVPEWWLDVRGNCVERATWEAQSGVTHVVPTDQLCCVSDACRDALAHIATQRRTTTTTGQVVDPQIPLNHDSELSIEHVVEAFWMGVKTRCAE